MSFNSEIISYLKKEKFVPSKKMGQNFLISDEYQKKIVDVLKIKEKDNILEIGPGFGSITRWILEYKNINLKIVELDKRLHEMLKNKHKNIEVINDDILKFDLFKYYKLEDKQQNKVVSNLPYSVSSKAIIKLVKSNLFETCVFMIQKEMADRITAKVGSKKYNNFTILLNILCSIKKEFDVPNTVFIPQPEVTSTVISITNNKDFDFSKTEKLERFLKICFSQKRKKIFNNLKHYYPSDKIELILKKCNVSKDIRPEQIPIEKFLEMFEEFNSVN